MKPVVLLTLVSLSFSLTIPINNSILPGSSPLRPFLLETNTPEAEPDSGLGINHGTYFYVDQPRTQSSDSSYPLQSLHLLLERYSDELFAAGLLLLIPITIGIVKFAELLSRSLSVEEFPDRGRATRRIESLKEREEWVLRRKEREIRVEKSRSWWSRR